MEFLILLFMVILLIKLINFKNDPLRLIGPLNKFIHKGYKFDVVVRTLKLVFTDTNIDNLINNLHRY